MMAYILQYILHYRINVIEENLKRSFPNKSKDEIARIRNNFYKNLSDVMLETLKGYTLSTNALLKRYRCLNPEVANNFYEQGRDLIFAMSHYANWEWGTQVASIYFKHQLISFYKPFSNKLFDDFINKNRLKHDMRLESIYKTKFTFRSPGEKPRAYFMLSDQSPSKHKNAYWTDFLNQETACLHGLEGYARLFDIPIIYVDVQRVKRGYYTTRLEVICDSPKNLHPGQVTGIYMKKLEEILNRKPDDWLWSHRRWKMKNSNQTINKNKNVVKLQNV